MRRLCLLVVTACSLAAAASPSFAAPWQDEPFRPLRFGDPTADPRPFFPDTPYDPSITPPDALLGQELGTRLTHPREVIAAFRTWATQSPRVTVETYARSHEGRELVYVVITTPDNQRRLPAILADVGRLNDPRGLADADAERLVRDTPAVAWLGYSIHGDEVSGCDAALALGYHLIAGQSAAVLELLSDVVVVIDPCMNPDGRERITTQVEQMAGAVPNLDHDSMQRGRWPWGRGNHYLFDMNRDWMAGTQPETRGRWRALHRFHPQLLVDAHEMGALDTYLFYPQSRPHNPQLPGTLAGWQAVFGDEQAAAFDRHGWAYYTREWADAWAPFYSDAWGSMNGAIGILYEQAGLSGFPLRRASGVVTTYRETVHHHAVSSLANVTSLRDHRADVLADYVAGRRANADPGRAENSRMYVLIPGRHPTREDALLRILLGQRVEVWRTREHVTVSGVEDTLGRRAGSLDVPPGSYLVRVAQPQAPIVLTYLGFDVRVDAESLKLERESLERKGETRMYDDTAWSLSHAFAVEAYWVDAAEVDAEPVADVPARPAYVMNTAADGAEAVAWVVDGNDDACLRFAVAALEQGLAVHVADRAFRTAGRVFPRGSLLVRRGENEADVGEKVARAVQTAGLMAYATSSGRSTDDGPDLGGQHFHLLHRPRVALLGNSPVAPDSFGHLWHLLDRELGVPVSQVDAQAFGGVDLRRFNVLVVPPARGAALTDHAESLQTWVRNGGTLIACGGSAAALTGKEFGLSQVVRRRDALKDVAGYEFAARRERAARHIELDEAAVWGDPPASTGPDGSAAGTPDAGSQPQRTESAPVPAPAAAGMGGSQPADGVGEAAADPATDETSDQTVTDPDAERQDEWMRRFAPSGVFVRGLVNEDAWITAGSQAEMPVFVSGSSVLLCREPVTAAVRAAGPDELRLSGLLWPEARQRLQHSALVTVERVGRGQVILFHTVPAYRGYVRGSARWFGNAVVLGPGAGASPPLGW